MKKADFIKKLSRALRPLIREERDKSTAYYSEIIDDHIESGLTEEEAVDRCGSIEEISAEIVADAATRGALQPKRRAFDMSLLIIGSPLWVAMLVAAGAIIIAVCAAVWAIIISIFAVLLALTVSGVAGVVSFFILLSVNSATAFMALGAGMICLGLGILLFLPIVSSTKWVIRVMATAWRSIWSRIFKKETCKNEKED